MKVGDYTNRFIYDRDNELGDVGNAFNALIDKIIQDTRKKKKEAEVLKEKAQKDTLTGLYNKGTTESLIEDFLAFETEEAIHALFIIDIDNFKSINDTLGHLYGDQVLNSISSSMLQIFRKSDILGRIGGDEFIIFIKNLNSEEAIIEKANEIIAMFNNSYGDTLDACLITGSIGIAVYPRDGKTFTELYKHADTALYKAKDEGKNCYHLLNTIK
jgi:diguanylate cyclase (GGDEF)-like protein